MAGNGQKRPFRNGIGVPARRLAQKVRDVRLISCALGWNMARMSLDKPIGPTDPRTRLRSVDAARGFALFGVLLVNMYNFGAYSPEWTGVIDRISVTAMHSVFETKSWRLFSILFGFGFALQMLKAETQAAGSFRFYFRRIVILFGIGVVHALFYDGDFLMKYAALGLILVAFRKLHDRALITLAFVLLAAFPVGNLIVSLSDDVPVAQSEETLTLAERREGHPYLGSLVDVFEANTPAIPPRIWSNLHGPESSLAVFAMFLLGLSVGRSRILHDIPRHLPLVRKVFGLGIGIGLTCAIAEWLLGQFFGYAVFRENTATAQIQFLGDILFAYGSTALAIGYAAGIVLLAQGCHWMPAVRPLENLGRMALTVYLSGTVMFTTLFYGYGFGQIFLIGPAEVTAFAILFFAIQVLFCAWWLRRFRFGPMEWAWRSLTYWKIQPLRVRGKTSYDSGY